MDGQKMEIGIDGSGETAYKEASSCHTIAERTPAEELHMVAAEVVRLRMKIKSAQAEMLFYIGLAVNGPTEDLRIAARKESIHFEEKCKNLNDELQVLYTRHPCQEIDAFIKIILSDQSDQLNKYIPPPNKPSVKRQAEKDGFQFPKKVASLTIIL